MISKKYTTRLLYAAIFSVMIIAGFAAYQFGAFDELFSGSQGQITASAFHTSNSDSKTDSY